MISISSVIIVKELPGIPLPHCFAPHPTQNPVINLKLSSLNEAVEVKEEKHLKTISASRFVSAPEEYLTFRLINSSDKVTLGCFWMILFSN
jgi:hypothetical protein